MTEQSLHSRSSPAVGQPNPVSDARGAFLGRLIDDAGLFPPASLTLPAAQDAHGRAAGSARAWILGRFVVPASRLAELRSLRGRWDAAPALSVVIDGPLESSFDLVASALREPEAPSIEACECRLSNGREHDADVLAGALLETADSAGGFGRQRALYVEVDVTERDVLEAQLHALARRRAAGAKMLYAKMRCGGESAAAVPASERVAHFIALAHALDVPFKATAGLHHAVRAHSTAAGFTLHGFLNVAGAAVLAASGLTGEAALSKIVADEDVRNFGLDRDHFRWRELTADSHQIALGRARGFLSYGSCSFDEPVADLVAAGILPTNGT